MRRIALLAVGGLLIGACADTTAPQPEAPLANGRGVVGNPDLAQEAPFVPGRVLVRFASGADAPGLARAAGGQVDRILGVGVHVLSVPFNAEAQVVRALSRNPNVIFAEPDYLKVFGDPASIPVDDPYIGYKWDLDNDGSIYSSSGAVLTSTGAADADMDWKEAVQALGSASGSARVGIMDSGIRNDHQEFTGRIAAQYDFFDNDGNAEDDNGHGSHVAGIAAAATDNGIGVAGVAFTGNVDFAIAKVCGAYNPFQYGCPSSAIADGIRWAVDNGADVLNLSLGGGGGSTTTRSALQYARANGVLPICAAGNDGGAVSYPGAWPECVAVSATDWGDGLASYSNFGPEVVVSAPGGDFEDSNGYSYILSAYNGSSSDYAFLAGTSMASPQVAGLGALLHVLGVAGDAEKVSVMTSTADDLGAPNADDLYGAGRVNVAAAVAAATGGSTNSAPTAGFSSSCTELVCSFTDTSSDSDGDVVSWSWDFGDGETSNAQNPSRGYATGATYTVRLTVTDDDGASSFIEQDVTVEATPTPNSPPNAGFSSNCTDLVCSFTDESSDSDGDVVSWSWDFGDGTGSTAQNPSHDYAAGGNYDVSLTVTDDDGSADTFSATVTVEDPVAVGGIELTADGTKRRGRHEIVLSWSGADSANVDIIRDGEPVATTANDGSYTDATGNRGGRTYVYRICEAASDTACSDPVTVVY